MRIYNLIFDIIFQKIEFPQSTYKTTTLDLPGFKIEQTPTESSVGGTLICISQNLSCKPQKDFPIYCPKELESVFIEVLIPSKKSRLIRAVCEHPFLKHAFNNNFLSTLLEKLTLDNKPFINTGDFNLNLTKYMQNTGVNPFLEKILSNNFIQTTEKSATLIDNIFTNSYKHNSNSASGNITTSTFKHLPQFLVIENLNK